MSLEDLVLKVHHKGGSSSMMYSDVKTFADIRARLEQKMPRHRFRIQGADLFFQDRDLVSRAVRLGAAFRIATSGERIQEFILEDPSDSGGGTARRDLHPSGIKRLWKSGFLLLRDKTNQLPSRPSRKKKEKKQRWTRYYFVYCGGSLFWFNDVRAYQLGQKALDCLPMGGLVPDQKDPIVDERPHAFALKIPESWSSPSRGNTLYLDCSGAQTKAEWVRAMTDGRIRRKACTMLQILPYIVEKFPKSLGIFRKAGHAGDIKHYMQLIDQGMYPDYNKIDREHDLTGVMKRNLRSMSEPLLTQTKYADFVRIGRTQNVEKRVDELREIIRSLPIMNRVFARELFEGLNKISKFSDISKMTPSNLAIVIGPNILRMEGLDPIKAVSDNGSIVDVVTTMIEHWEEVFPGDSESEFLANNAASSIFGMASALRMGIPRLSTTMSSPGRRHATKVSPSFADRFKKRDTGLYGMPSSAMPSFGGSSPPSLPSYPKAPGPPPDLKALSRPSIRNSVHFKSFRGSHRKIPTKSIIKEDKILEEAKPAEISPLGPPTLVSSTPKLNSRKKKKPSRKRKVKRGGLPKRPKALTDTVSYPMVRQRSQPPGTGSKLSGPPQFIPKIIPSQHKSLQTTIKSGPPPPPSHKRQSKSLNSEQIAGNLFQSRPPNPPASFASCNLNGNSDSESKSLRENQENITVLPSPPSALPVTTSRSSAASVDSPFKFGHTRARSSGIPSLPNFDCLKVGPPPAPSSSDNSIGPGSALRLVKSNETNSRPSAISSSDEEVGECEDSNALSEEEKGSDQSDNTIVQRCERAGEICRAFQQKQNNSKKMLKEEFERFEKINAKLIEMLERHKFPAQLTVEKLESIFNQMEDQRVKYKEAISKIHQFMNITLNSDEMITASFVQDGEKNQSVEDSKEEDNWVYAKFAYNGGVRDNELVFEGGDIIKVLEQGSGWSRGKNLNASGEGWFPTSYVGELDPSYFEDRETL